MKQIVLFLMVITLAFVAGCEKQVNEEQTPTFARVVKIDQADVQVSQVTTPLVFQRMKRLLGVSAQKTIYPSIDSNTIVNFVLQHAYHSQITGMDKIYFKMRVIHGGQSIPINAMNFICESDGVFDPYVFVPTTGSYVINWPLGSVLTYAPGNKLYFCFQSLTPIYMGSPYLQGCSFNVSGATYITWDTSDPHNTACSPDGYVNYRVNLLPDTLLIPGN